MSTWTPDDEMADLIDEKFPKDWRTRARTQQVLTHITEPEHELLGHLKEETHLSQDEIIECSLAYCFQKENLGDYYEFLMGQNKDKYHQIK